jgi:fatty-acyl-CoA synthase
VNTPQIAGAFLDRASRLYGGSIGVVCGATRLTYGQVADRVDRLSSALRARGVTPGDVVACLSFNCHRLLELYYAVPNMGAILLPVNIRLTPVDIAFIIADSAASIVFVDRALAGLLAPIRDRLPGVRRVILMGQAPLSGELDGDDYEDLVAHADPHFDRPSIDEDAVAELFYTSGTTALPKGVMLTHRNLVAHGVAVAVVNRPLDTDVQLHSIPLFHVNGWGTPHTITMVGGTHVMLPKFDPEEVLAVIEREHVTCMLMVPTMAVALLNAPSARSKDLRSLRLVMLGGAATPPSLLASLDAWLPDCEIYGGYGLSETTPVLSVALMKRGLRGDADHLRVLRCSAGLPVPGVEIEIVDGQGHAVPHDGKSTGEICARGNTVMKGYWNRPDDTRAVIVDGWFHTGDVGAIDSDGYVHIVDRTKDIIITGGENVASLEIENAIYEHPAVLECAVIAAPDPKWGEVPLAVIVLKPGSAATESDIIDRCKQRLASFKLPKRVAFASALPKGGTGKILKRELRETYASQTPARP